MLVRFGREMWGMCRMRREGREQEGSFLYDYCRDRWESLTLGKAWVGSANMGHMDLVIDCLFVEIARFVC